MALSAGAGLRVLRRERLGLRRQARGFSGDLQGRLEKLARCCEVSGGT